MFKVKIIVVGPVQSGKTTIANFLSDQSEFSSGGYRPTQGCRIVEFESQVNIKGRQSTVEVELWDCSGDKRFESCWPALAKDAVGVVLVYNPDQINHDMDIESWYNYLVNTTSIKAPSAIAFAHIKPGVTYKMKPSLPASLAKVPVIRANLEEDADGVRSEFQKYLSSVVSTLSDKNDQEELSIMNNR